ncbi:hypothetical protein ACI6Q2_08760 [Chitinophagaceae bacterium LWZ2-11]
MFFKKSCIVICIVCLTSIAKAQLNPVGTLLDENQLVLVAGTTVIRDPTAAGGSCMYRPATAANSTLWYGPYAHLQGGNYLIQFKLKVSSNASNLYLLSVDLTKMGGSNEFARFDIYPNMFRNSNEWQLFTIPIQLSADITDLEIRGMDFHGGITDVYLDNINIIPGDFRGNYSDQFTVTGKGNVGIGTTNPSSALDVGGLIQISSTNSAVPPAGLNYGLFPYAGVGIGLFSGASGATQGIGFWTNPNNIPTEVVRILSTGNVGIGTMSPGNYKLAVEGKLGARKIVVTQAPAWPDYVFDSSYTLAPLAQVEQFIKDNKHLPDVPSAKEVTDKGLDVGENQVVLLKKIEELTLYMIEMKKENIEMKKENTELKQRVNKLENKK